VVDFAEATAHIRRGFCPLCGVLMRRRNLTPDGIESLRCDGCEVGWHLTAVDRRTMLTTDRPLRPNEVRFLYASR
jgi:hypothetical protein